MPPIWHQSLPPTFCNRKWDERQRCPQSWGWRCWPVNMAQSFKSFAAVVVRHVSHPQPPAFLRWVAHCSYRSGQYEYELPDIVWLIPCSKSLNKPDWPPGGDSTENNRLACVSHQPELSGESISTCSKRRNFIICFCAPSTSKKDENFHRAHNARASHEFKIKQPRI